MSRRHHGNRPHRSSGPPRPSDPVRSGLDAPATAASPDDRAERLPTDRAEPNRRSPDERASTSIAVTNDPGLMADPAPASPAVALAGEAPRVDVRPPADGPVPEPDGRGPRPESSVTGAMATCTAPQLRRFIKSRPYVPMHELRRRFGINGAEDDVSSIDLGAHRVFVGLPPREGSLLGELLRGGDIGYELSLDPRTPIVIGLYPMRPVARS
jgi:hypothetical protein